MNSCKEISSQIPLWLDGELKGEESTLFQSHIAQCEACRERIAAERRFLETIRNSRPLHQPSDQLRQRVTEILAQQPVQAKAPTRLRRRIVSSLTAHGLLQPAARSLSLARYVAVAVVIACLAIAIVIWRTSKPYEEPAVAQIPSFAQMAADTHRRYLQKQLPLEIVSDQPDEISNWFNGKVSFGLKLPNYQDKSGQPKLYKLEGGRLVGYKEDYAAYVAYQMDERPISLVVTSASVAQPEGGEQIADRGLTFHFESIYGYKVITWSDRGLTYALVSDLEERGQQSCGVCHQGADQDLIERLKPNATRSNRPPIVPLPTS